MLAQEHSNLEYQTLALGHLVGPGRLLFNTINFELVKIAFRGHGVYRISGQLVLGFGFMCLKAVYLERVHFLSIHNSKLENCIVIQLPARSHLAAVVLIIAGL